MPGAAKCEAREACADAYFLGRLCGALPVGYDGGGAAEALEARRRAGDGEGWTTSGGGPGVGAGESGPGRREGRAGAEGQRRRSHHWLGGV